MALLTKCKFYYGPEIELNLNYIDFSEGGGPELFFSIPVKMYSPLELANTIAEGLNATGSLTYSVTLNRSTRFLTISASGPFELLISSGSHSGSNIWQKMGFIGGVDLTGFASYSSTAAVGYSYSPQFYLLDYIPLDHWQEAVDSSINITGSGRVEVVRYGVKKFTQFSIELITNNKFLGDSMYESDIEAVENITQFLEAATRKSVVEFMPDRSDEAVYQLLILEKTEQSQNGIGFKITEMLDYGAGYYKSGLLTWREVDL